MCSRTTGRALVCNGCCVASMFLSRKVCNRASQTNSNTDVLDSRRERADEAGASQRYRALLVWYPSLSRVYSKFSCQRLYTCCGDNKATEGGSTSQPFINNQSILQRASTSFCSWEDFRTVCLRAVRPLIVSSVISPWSRWCVSCGRW